MRTKSETGNYGEKLAAEFLQSHGYIIRERNYRYRRLEIDLIAEKKDLVIFIEVKARTKTYFGLPEEAVDEKKADKIIEAADHYVYEINWNGNIRFDIISVILSGEQPTIKHFEDAFY
ncbi:MAG: YraN family protein [Bacteroidota bacterium]